ncbi:TonB-dependent receptor, partial [Runella sp.]|uniref:TonB-dependent receptor plug domain-containing protein n=1 Tax=Runella sp. TaxID=1960881 RepID=UPI00301A7C9C
MKQTYLAMLLMLLPLLRMSAQNDSCIFSFKGKLLDENDRPIIGQIITADYRYSIDDRIVKSTITRSGVDGTFEICIQKPAIPQYLRLLNMQKYVYSLKIKINRKNHIQYSSDLTIVRDRFDLGEIYLKKIPDLESPIPTDIIEARDLAATGQTSIGKALHYSSPGFNSTTQPVSDGGAHFDATDFRNLGAGRTMIQINGKRKNPSAYLPPNEIPGKSESGVDIRSIPIAALEQVRIERQEATTLFGSDAIGGLVDFQLKGYHPKLEMHAFSGINKDKLDGFNTGLDVTKGFRLGNDGFFTITYSFLNQQESNRANSPGYDSLYADSNDPKWKSWIAKNPTLGMHIGDPQLLSNTLFYNTKTSFRGESQSQFYSFGGLSYRNTKSYAIYRAPYIVKNDYHIFSSADSTYNGFQPTFESDVRDHFFVFGLEGSAGNGVIHYDVSQTIAGNDIDFSVDSSFNPTLGANSPTNFKTGGYKLSNNNTRFAFDWTIDSLWTLKAGTDFRSEEYTIKPGEETSYSGDGTISYPGTRPQNSLTANRNNFGVFSQIGLNVKRFTGDLSARYESYSKFDPDYALKIAGLFRVIDQENTKWVLRGSYSTGFRAPALQQLYYNRVQTLISGSTISNRGTFNTYSPVLRQLEVPRLQNESSKTFSIGTALNTTFWNKSRFTVAADYYDVTIKDRIVLSSTIDSSRIADPNNIEPVVGFCHSIKGWFPAD